MPKDAAAILSLAAKVNGLGAPGLQPWHLKASYKTYDDSGKPSGDGTYEMFWAGSRQYKQVFTSAAFTQTEYGTADGVFRVGDAGSVPYPQRYVVEQMLHPLPSQRQIEDGAADKEVKMFGTSKLDCIMLSQKIEGHAFSPFGLYPTYCISPEKPVLRFTSFSDSVTALFNQLTLFQGRVFAKQIDVTADGHPSISAAVDTLGDLGTMADAFFAPTATAVKVDTSPTEVDAKVMAGRAISRPDPHYPVAELRSRITGTVEIAAVIGRDGRIHEMTVTRSPDVGLAVAALLAVRTWRYTPYQVNGNSVDVKTTIDVTFMIG